MAVTVETSIRPLHSLGLHTVFLGAFDYYFSNDGEKRIKDYCLPDVFLLLTTTVIVPQATPARRI